MSKLTVVGGVYSEICHFPQWTQLYGSAGRAAIAASLLCDSIELHTCIGASDEADLAALAAGHGVGIVAQTLPHTIEFEYFHGLATPRTWPVLTGAPATTLKVTADAILRFGMVEAEAVVHGGRVVYDPQAPLGPQPFRANGSMATELAIVVNRAEGAALTGKSDPGAIADALLGEPGATVAIVKQGPDGALVATKAGKRERVPAFETEAVFPIGSGDVFSGVFAAQWASNGQDPVSAAHFASCATAYYCTTRSLPIPRTAQEISENIGQLRPLNVSRISGKPKCYLAGPFFTMGQRWLVEEACLALKGQGLEVFSPFHEVGLGHADDVVPKDLEAIRNSDIVFAIVDGLDSGTLFEIGYARARDLPVIAFAEQEQGQDLKLLQGSGCRIEKDFTTAVYRANWMAHKR